MIYADRLPSWLDLENLVYWPLLLYILPGICGTEVCALIDRYLSHGGDCISGGVLRSLPGHGFIHSSTA